MLAYHFTINHIREKHMRIRIFLCGLIIFGVKCASLQIETDESQSIQGKWEMACLRCAKPKTFFVTFTANNQIGGDKTTLCENLMPTVFFPSLIIDRAENCKMTWQRSQNQNEITIVTGKMTAKYKVKQVTHQKSIFFEAVYVPDVPAMPSPGKFEIIFLVKRLADS
jgi:hypothetical protein